MNIYFYLAYATEDKSTDDGIRFDKVLIKAIGGILFLKLIHNSKKDNKDIDDKQIEPLKRVLHGKNIIYILPY